MSGITIIWNRKRKFHYFQDCTWIIFRSSLTHLETAFRSFVYFPHRLVQTIALFVDNKRNCSNLYLWCRMFHSFSYYFICYFYRKFDLFCTEGCTNHHGSSVRRIVVVRHDAFSQITRAGGSKYPTDFVHHITYRNQWVYRKFILVCKCYILNKKIIKIWKRDNIS